MAHNITDFSSIVLRKPGLVKDTDLIKSFVHVLKNLKETISPDGLEYLFKRIVEHIRTYGEIPLESSTEDIQILLEVAYNEFYSIVSELTPDPNLLALIQNNSDVILNKFVHIVTDRTLYEKIFHDWYIASESKNYFTGTEEEFRHYVFKFFKIYDTDVPTGADQLTTAISVQVFNEYLLDPHDEDVDAHGGTLGDFMTDLLPVYELPIASNDTAEAIVHEPPSQAIKSYEMFVKTFKFFECSEDTEIRITELRGEYVHNTTLTPVIDVYKIDEQSLYRPTSLTGLTLSRRNYLDWYQEEFNNSVGISKYSLFEQDELKFMLLHKKSDYYSDHDTYLIDPDASQVLQDIAQQEHSDPIEYYYKMVNLFCEVPDEYAIHCKFKLNKLYTKTRDILNITNHSRSILAVYMQPYVIGNNSYNRLRLAFDNFNPSMSYTLVDNIVEDDFNEVEFVARVRGDITDMFCRVNNVLTTWSYPNSLRMYDKIPVTMFLGLFMNQFKRRNNTLSYINIYDAEISDVAIKNLIVGYQ